MLNKGYLNASRNNDECYTPHYAVNPLIKYISSQLTVWCPFDTINSAFVNELFLNGNKVIYSHINNGKDFFKYEPPYYDIIISNPPFSIKDAVIKRLYELNKPFAILLPIASIQGVTRYKYFKNGIQLLVFDQRIGFHTQEDLINTIEGSPFASAYFCKDLLPNDLIVEHLNKYNAPLYINPIRVINEKESTRLAYKTIKK